MSKYVFLCCCVLLLSINAFGETYESGNFIIHSDLDSSYVQLLQKNAEAYYRSIKLEYFKNGAGEPLRIYYSNTQADTQNLLDKDGHNVKAGSGCYISFIPALYIHRLTDDGKDSGLDPLFCGIARHLIELDFTNSPVWFKEGLAAFLGERARIVNDELIIGRPNPWREQILRDKIENGGVRLNLKHLFSTSAEQFSNWDIGVHFARAFFYWLYEEKHLEEFLNRVAEKGCEFSVLEETSSVPSGKINLEFTKFVKKDCYAAAYLKDGRQAEDPAEKTQAFLKALELKPYFLPAQFELARCYYHQKDYENCRANLKQILTDPKSIEYLPAAELMGDTYYSEKDYLKALEYYTKANEYSDYYEYKYRIVYKMANCYYYLKEPDNAKSWYRKFLDCKWDQERTKTCADYAQKYIQYINALAAEQERNKIPIIQKLISK